MADPDGLGYGREFDHKSLSQQAEVMKESIGAYIPPPRGHDYTAPEVQMRLARLENELRDLSGIRASILGNMGRSGSSGYYGSSGFSGSSGYSPGASGACGPYSQIVYEQKAYDDFSHEGFFAKGIRELKEYFQALFAKLVKITNRKEIEHGK